MNETRENVAADIVGTQDEPWIGTHLPDRRPEERVAILFVGQVRRDGVGEYGQQADNNEDRKPRHRTRVSLK